MAWIHKSFDISTEGRIPSLDGLRAIAILLVFNTHFFGYFYNRKYFDDPVISKTVAFLRNGDIGVDLFFVISGYLMFTILRSGRETSAGYFFGRRALRLLPAHLVTTLFLLHGPFLLSDFLLNLLFLAPIVPGTVFTNPVTWSLTTEALFYLIIFCAFRIIHRKYGDWAFIAGTAFSIFGVILAAQVASRASAGNEMKMTAEILMRLAGYLDLGRTTGFLVGMTLPMISGYFKKRRTELWFSLWLAAAALMIVRYKFGDGILHLRFSGGYFIACALVFGGIVLSALNGAGSKLLSSLPMQILGKLSYSFYLIHYALCENIHLFFPHIRSATDLVISYIALLAMTVVLSALLYLHVERPYFAMGRSRPGSLGTKPGTTIKPGTL